MHYDFAPRRIAHVRRIHRCLDCGTLIPIGAPAVAVCGNADGFWYGHLCTNCEFESAFESYTDAMVERHLIGHV